MLNKKTNRVGSIVTFVVSALLIVSALWLYFNRQFVIDTITVWSYQPSETIQAIQSNAEFTDKGRFVFYATQPALEQQDAFNRECPRQEERSPILGCYTNDDRIYIYDLTNERLDGMEEVTAAHEMLHAVWRRMSDAEREKIAAELQTAYEKTDNAALKDRMAYYERTEPGELHNELHSILGTEIASLGEPLESYYGKYFDRSTVLALHAKYSSVYNGLYDRASELYSQMESLASSIESRSAEYQTAVRQYTADIQSFNTRANNGSFSSQNQFNRERAVLVARSAVLNNQRQAVNASITTYNKYYSEYQDIAKQIEVLNESIDSFHQIDQAPSV